MKHDGTGFDLPSGEEGLSHYGGDVAEKPPGNANDAGSGAHPKIGGEGNGDSRTTPLGGGGSKK